MKEGTRLGSYGGLSLVSGLTFFLLSCAHPQLPPPPLASRQQTAPPIIETQPVTPSTVAKKTITPPPPAIEPSSQPKQARIVLVLGAGAVKGFAHIGVLKVLEANSIPIHSIVGTSAGSFVGALYAYGHNAFQIQKIAIELQKEDVMDPAIPETGLIRGQKLADYVNAAVKQTPLEKLRIPFYAVATDVQTGQEMVFGRGNTGSAVQASCSVPGLFQPLRIGDRKYMDGGAVSPVAVAAAKKYGGDVVIAVDLSADTGAAMPETVVESRLRSAHIMYSKLTQEQCSQADVVIQPKLGHIGPGDFSKRHELVLEGEKAAMEALPKIKEIMERLKVVWGGTRVKFRLGKGFEKFDSVILKAAEKYKVDHALVKAVIKAESNFNAMAVSRKGAKGLMQLMPATAASLQVNDSFHPEENIEGGVRYLRYLLNIFKGNLECTLAAYNAGETAVFRYNGVPPYPHTRIYVRRVLQFLDKYRQESRNPPALATAG